MSVLNWLALAAALMGALGVVLIYCRLTVAPAVLLSTSFALIAYVTFAEADYVWSAVYAGLTLAVPVRVWWKARVERARQTVQEPIADGVARMLADYPSTVPVRAGMSGGTVTIERVTHRLALESGRDVAGTLAAVHREDGHLVTVAVYEVDLMDVSLDDEAGLFAGLLGLEYVAPVVTR